MHRLHWGILGTGNIAQQFAEGVAHAHRSRVVSVGSRTQRNADDFAEKFDIPHSHGTYEALLNDTGVEAVYVSLPNSMHCDWTLRALEAGKHVLCEKPIAANADEAERMFDAADRHGRVLVEAMMYRSHPVTKEIVQQVGAGTIGTLKLIRTSFCVRARHTQGNIRFDPELAGGALMDLGCYCLSLSRLLTGEEPEDVHGVAHLHETGVDDYAAGTLRFPSGVLATFACGMTLQANNTAHVSGDEGYIEIPVPWKPPMNQARYIVASMTPPRQDREKAKASGKRAGPTRKEHEVNAPVPLYGVEADDFASTVLDGAAPAVSAADSIGNMRLLDALREQVGVEIVSSL